MRKGGVKGEGRRRDFWAIEVDSREVLAVRIKGQGVGHLNFHGGVVEER